MRSGGRPPCGAQREEKGVSMDETAVSRVPRIAAITTLALAASIPVLPAGERGQDRSNPCDYPATLIGASGQDGVRILHLEKGIGFHQLEGPLNYFIDPGLGTYGPEGKASPGLRDLSESMKPLIEAPAGGGKPRILVPIQQAIDEFMKLVSKRPPERWSSLKDFLTNSPPLQRRVHRIWITFGLRFWIRKAPAGEELQCRLELRAFKAKIDYDQGTPNLAQCELVFQDSAVGTVRRGCPSKLPEEEVRAVIIDALRNRIAVNFCLNPSLRPEADQKEGGVLGKSIDQVQG